MVRSVVGRAVSKVPAAWQAVAGFIVLSLIGLSLRDGFDRYINSLYTFYDVGNYVEIAAHGYTWFLSAFHPIWPLLIKIVSVPFGVETLLGFGLTAGLLSTAIFFYAVFVLWETFTKIFGSQIANVSLLLFVFNPASVFHATGFSESICTLLIAYLIKEFHGANRIWVLGLIAALVSLARPVAYFLPTAVLLAWPLANVAAGRKWYGDWKRPVVMSIAAVSAYVFYCFYLLYKVGDFFVQARAHDAWGRKLGLYWQLIYAPASVGGSTQVLMWDLLAFYMPIIISVLSAIALLRPVLRSRYKNVLSDPLYWFLLLLTASQSAATFLSYPIFASTSRHVFGIPSLFYCLARIFEVIHFKKSTLYVAVLVSAGFFVRWWARFGKGSWIG